MGIYKSTQQNLKSEHEDKTPSIKDLKNHELLRTIFYCYNSRYLVPHLLKIIYKNT